MAGFHFAFGEVIEYSDDPKLPALLQGLRSQLFLE
jgi:hypothetical protein